MWAEVFVRCLLGGVRGRRKRWECRQTASIYTSEHVRARCESAVHLGKEKYYSFLLTESLPFLPFPSPRVD